jgi:hypothetical protein
MTIKRILAPWLIATALCLVYCLIMVAKSGGDPLELAKIGTQFSAGISAQAGGTEGYDGQFIFYIVRDPSSAAQYLDVPAYRFQRILLPVLGMLLSFGNVALIPWALLIINLAALAVGTALLEGLLEQHKVNRWYALGYGLTLGTFGAARLSLPEPLAYGLVLGGIVLASRERWLWSAVVLALAAFAKETSLVFVAGYGVYLLVRRHWWTAILFGAVAVLPFAAWQMVLYNKFGAFGIGSGGKLATSFEIVPYMGVIRILTEGGVLPFILFLAILGPFVILPTLWGLRACWREFQTIRKGEAALRPYTSLLFFNAALLLFVPFSTYREPLGILRFIVGLQIAVILYAAERRNLRVLLNSTIWVVTLLFIIVSDFATKS